MIKKYYEKINIDLIVKWMIVLVFIVSSIMLFYFYFIESYIAEAHIAKTLPLSIVVAATSIAIAITIKNNAK